MEINQNEIGKRLRFIRENYIMPGIKLSANQVAKLLNSTSDKILNYERGLSNIPNAILISLYQLGINPVYILTGEENVFANNTNGKLLAEKYKIISKNQSLYIKKLSDDNFKTVKAAAKDLRENFDEKR